MKPKHVLHRIHRLDLPICEPQPSPTTPHIDVMIVAQVALKTLVVASAWLVTPIASQASSSLTNNLNDCVSDNDFQAGIDYFPDKFTPVQYTPEFLIGGNEFVPDSTTDVLTIDYFNTYKIVTNKHVNQTYLLYQCGTEPPADQLDGRHHIVLSVPHKGGIAITGTTQIVPLEMIGKRSEIRAYIDNPLWLTSPCMNTLIDDGKIEVFYDENDPYNSTITKGFRQEFLRRNPDGLIFGTLFGDPTEERVMTISASNERTNVATFDWIGLFAALFNLERVSNRIAAETKSRYDCSAANARVLSANRVDRPIVLWAFYFEGLGWSLAQCPTWDHTYYCEMGEHCGADIINRPEGVGTEQYGYWYLNDDELYEVGKDADIFIFAMNTWDSVYQRKNETLDKFKSVQNKMVFDILGQGEWAWSEQRAAEYDVVTLDFCEIVGNGNDVSQFPHKVKWFRNAIEDAPSQEIGECAPEDVYEPYEPLESFCTPLPADYSSSFRSGSFTPIMSCAAVLMAMLFR